MPRPRDRLLALVGPTASGKTEAALTLAERFGAEIVSVDSMLIYRGMDIGTAKPTPDERARVPHHLLDLAEPSEALSVAQYQAEAQSVLTALATRDTPALLVGGSGLYFRACVDDLVFPSTDPALRSELETQAGALGAARLYARLEHLDPVGAAKIEPGNIRRTIRALEVAGLTGKPFSSFSVAWEHYPADRVRVAGVEIDRAVQNERIAARVDAMLARGWIDEVTRLIDAGFAGWLTSTQAIGYAEMARHLRGELALEEALALTVTRTKQLARRQMAWFRRDPRVRWFRAGARGAAEVTEEIAAYLGSGA